MGKQLGPPLTQQRLAHPPRCPPKLASDLVFPVGLISRWHSRQAAVPREALESVAECMHGRDLGTTQPSSGTRQFRPDASLPLGAQWSQPRVSREKYKEC